MSIVMRGILRVGDDDIELGASGIHSAKQLGKDSSPHLPPPLSQLHVPLEWHVHTFLPGNWDFAFSHGAARDDV